VNQLSLLDILDPPLALPAPPPPDPVMDAVIASGLAPNEYILTTNRTLGGWGVSAPAKSRIYLFPIEFMHRDRFGGEASKLLLNHPAIGDLAYVRHVANATGITPHWEPEDEFGRDRGKEWRWFHAVDLMCERDWLHLMETRELTDNAAIAGAVRYGVEDGRISTDTARTILDLLDAAEPDDRSEAALLGNGIWPAHIIERNSKGKVTSERRPINIMTRGAAGAWLAVHGIEDGWFKRGRDGFLQMSPDGLARRESETGP
jgi:hypothetical protein